MLFICGVEDSERVPIGDTDGTADNGLGSRERGEEEAEDEAQRTHTRCVPAICALAAGVRR